MTGLFKAKIFFQILLVVPGISAFNQTNNITNSSVYKNITALV